MRNYAANLNHGGGERWLAELNVAGNLNERVWMLSSHRIRSFARLPSFFLFHWFLAPFVILTLHDDIILSRPGATRTSRHWFCMTVARDIWIRKSLFLRGLAKRRLVPYSYFSLDTWRLHSSLYKYTVYTIHFLFIWSDKVFRNVIDCICKTSKEVLMELGLKEAPLVSYSLVFS